MSVLESLARARSGPEGGRRLPRLRLVPQLAGSRPRAPFVLLIVVILGGGLVGLLLLNTTLQQGSFQIHDLARQTSALEERQGDLEQQVAQLKAPESLAARARTMGMVPNTNPVFLRLTDSAVLGDAVPARPRPKPTPKPTPTASAGSTPAATPGANQPAAGQPATGHARTPLPTPTPAAGDR
ncbi:MAG TPA: hypothetical protein VE287_13550 [Actinopolymorphaceae bacterium]|jgi:cell division protein FtsB|nr:hypothetical protein [Actinopolymorphaceae bacterium]